MNLNDVPLPPRYSEVSKFRVQITRQAEEDLIEIHSAIAKLNPQGADRMLFKIEERMNALVDYPERGFRRPHIRKDLRIVVEGDYLIFYRVEESSVHIVRVVYGRRDLLKLELN